MRILPPKYKFKVTPPKPGGGFDTVKLLSPSGDLISEMSDVRDIKREEHPSSDGAHTVTRLSFAESTAYPELCSLAWKDWIKSKRALVQIATLILVGIFGRDPNLPVVAFAVYVWISW